MNREEWRKLRKQGIGGSDAGAVIGLNRYKTAFDVYADKLGLVPEMPDNEAMRQGRDLEEYVAQRFTEKTGLKVKKHEEFIRNSEYPFAFANVDRLIEGENAGLECKTANSLSLKRYKNGEYPEEYYCQCMHYMAVTGFDKWYLAVLIFGTEFKIFEIKRDEEEIKSLMQAEQSFWENNIQKRKPPAPMGTEQNDRTINELYPYSNAATIILPSEKLIKEREEKVKLIKKLEQDKAKIEQEIKLMLGENEAAEGNNYIVTWKSQSRQTFDYKRFAEETDIDLSEYIKTSTYRVLKIKEVK